MNKHDRQLLIAILYRIQVEFVVNRYFRWFVYLCLIALVLWIITSDGQGIRHWL